jgi:hypothetical protein
MIGKKIRSKIAIGQHATKRRHQRITTSKVRIQFFIAGVYKHPAKIGSCGFLLNDKIQSLSFSKVYSELFNDVHTESW